ncbi:MAG: hypothetical protein HIU85_20105 [Proteobacteria bacterium]|nr:hypothetical protein [Pseudomonadota bacterium]
MTRDGAVTDALVNAINRVNGVVINEQTLGVSLDAGFRTTSLGSTRPEAQGAPGAAASSALPGPGGAGAPQTTGLSLASGAYAKFMEQETHGAIKSYSILSVNQGKRGTWHARVRATIAKLVTPKEALRRSIAVLPPKISSEAISIDGSHSGRRQAQTFTTQAIVSSLAGTQKFTVLDREHTRSLNAELSTIRTGQASISDYALLGKRLFADYVLVTRIDRLHYRVAVTHFIDTSRTLSTRVGGITVFYELIDPVTAQVVASGTVRTRLNAAQMEKYGSLRTNRGRIQALSSYIGERIANAISSDLFPIMVVDATGNHVVIAEGTGALHAGERYQVFEYGSAIKDPYTGENLGREETACCVVTISRTTPNLAYGVVSGLGRSFQEIFRPDTFILRNEAPESNPKAAKARNSAIERMIKKQNSVFGST